MNAPPGSHAANVLATEVPVAVTVANRVICLGEVLELAPGVVLKLDQQKDQALHIETAGQHVGNGTAVKIGDRLGVKFQSP